MGIFNFNNKRREAEKELWSSSTSSKKMAELAKTTSDRAVEAMKTKGFAVSKPKVTPKKEAEKTEQESKRPVEEDREQAEEANKEAREKEENEGKEDKEETKRKENEKKALHKENEKKLKKWGNDIDKTLQEIGKVRKEMRKTDDESELKWLRHQEVKKQHELDYFLDVIETFIMPGLEREIDTFKRKIQADKALWEPRKKLRNRLMEEVIETETTTEEDIRREEENTKTEKEEAKREEKTETEEKKAKKEKEAQRKREIDTILNGSIKKVLLTTTEKTTQLSLEAVSNSDLNREWGKIKELLPNLTTLKIEGTRYDQLSTAEISRTKLDNTILKFFREQLEVLELPNNYITDLSWLRGENHLKKLDLTSNGIITLNYDDLQDLPNGSEVILRGDSNVLSEEIGDKTIADNLTLTK